jgi:regulator of protease activity HflC (stomatin/prohibitin superfamily)
MNAYMPLLILAGAVGLVVVIALLRSIRIVPAQTVMVVERLGKYSSTMEAGIHLLVPFLDKVNYRHILKEQAVEVPSQPCFTLDNVKVEVDGVLYLKVVDAKKASYGISDYMYATIQLAQTTMRSVIGKMELDRCFEERQTINADIVKSVDEAADPWGVQVTRYEIQNISVPENVLTAMEVQMRAERERRAEIARSEGDMESRINYSLGIMEEAINRSEGEKQRRINEAEGQALEVKSLAKATAIGITRIAEAIQRAGGEEAVALQMAENYLSQLARLAKENTQLVLPMDLTTPSSVTQIVNTILEEGAEKE